MDKKKERSHHSTTPPLQRPRSSLKPAILSFVAYWVITVMGMTWRLRLEDQSGQVRIDAGRSFIFAIWHCHIGIMPVAYKKYWRGRCVATLVSASKDGEILARTLRRFGFHPVRGSTSRRGPQSLLEMVRCGQEGHDAAVTPDGPRGPAEVVQEGVIHLAKLTGAPIIPVSCTVSRFIRMKSWDRFVVPLPFSRIVIYAGKPILVPCDADAETLEARRLQLQDKLKELAGQ